MRITVENNGMTAQVSWVSAVLLDNRFLWAVIATEEPYLHFDIGRGGVVSLHQEDHVREPATNIRFYPDTPTEKNAVTGVPYTVQCRKQLDLMFFPRKVYTLCEGEEEVLWSGE